MFDVFKKVIGFVFPNIDPDISRSSLNEEEILKNYRHAVGLDVEEVELTGVITQRGANCVEIDDTYSYQLQPDDRFVNGDQVRYTVKKSRAGVEILNLTLEQPIEDLAQKIFGFVSRISPTELELNNDNVYSLRKAKMDFEPAVGDSVIVTANPAQFELSSEPCTAFRVQPNFVKDFCGVVKTWDPVLKQGTVDSDKIFTSAECKEYNPCPGDKVICSSVQTNLPDRRWRIIALTLNNIQHKGHSQLDISYPRQVDVLVGRVKTFDITMKNNTQRMFCLKNVNINPNRNVRLIEPIVNVVPPDAVVNFSIECYVDDVGPRKFSITWTLNSFFLTRTFKVVGVQDEGKAPLSLANKEILPAPRSKRRPAFCPIKTKTYSVPDHICVVGKDIHSNIFDRMLSLQSVYPSLAAGLTESTYGELMHNLLFLEEVAHDVEMDKLKCTAVLRPMTDHYIFEFPLDSPYTKISAGDKMFVCKPWEDNVAYEGKIWEVTTNKVFARFNKNFDDDFRNSALYSLSFKQNRSTHQRRHHALDVVMKKLGIEWLFPASSHTEAALGDLDEPNWINQALNKEQKTAIKCILNNTNLPYPYIIYGPPGTGKTLTLVELVLQIFTKFPEAKILVCAPTNSAIDSVGVRLIQEGLNKSDMIRLSSFSAFCQGNIIAELMDISFIPSLLVFTEQGRTTDERDLPVCYREDLGKHRVTLGTLNCVGVLNNVGFSDGHFTHVIVDEAGQTVEPELLIPAALIGKGDTQVVFAGDPQQLGPVVCSNLAKQYGLARSLLQRWVMTSPLYQKKLGDFMDTCGYNNRYITKLIRNYRSLPKIVEMISEAFYEGDLQPTLTSLSLEAKMLSQLSVLGESLAHRSKASNIFHNVNGTEEQMEDSYSWFNMAEVIQVIRVLNELYSQGVTAEQVGIITPYNLQAKKIVGMLEKMDVFTPKIGSVEEFQGQERQFVILSLVRCHGSSFGVSGFIADPQRVNVALSRAKILNVIIGHQHTLLLNGLWRNILAHCVAIQ